MWPCVGADFGPPADAQPPLSPRSLGGWKVETLSNLRARLPERIVEEAVYGMLPKGRIGHDIRTHHLKVFKGAEHPHEAQQPTDITHLIDAKPSPRF